MYNQDRKEDFAIWFASGKGTLKEISEASYTKVCGYLKRFEPIEERAGRDLCELEISDLQRGFTMVSGVHHRTSRDIQVLLKTYVSWCANAGYRVSDAIDHIKLDSDEKVRRCMIDSPASLKSLLDQVFPYPVRNQLFYIYRAYLWLALIGYEARDAVRIRKSDVDFASYQIVPSDPSLLPQRIYPEAYDDIWHACKLDVFEDYSRRKKVPSVMERQDSDLLLRWIAAKDENRKTEDLLEFIKPAVTREFTSYKNTRMQYPEGINDIIGIDATNHSVYMSGMFIRIFNDEADRIGLYLSKSDRMDYEQWKAAFMPDEAR